MELKKNSVEQAEDPGAIQALLISRIMNLDAHLTQHTYNFLTFNVFLATALAIAVGFSAQVPGFSYLIPLLGCAISALHLALGRRLERGILFFREYLHLVEKKTKVAVDLPLFDFYERSQAETVFGEIQHDGKNSRPMYRTFPWSLPFIRSTNTLTGVGLPTLIAAFWFASLFFLFWRDLSGWMRCLALVLLGIAFFLLQWHTWLRPPAKPRAVTQVNQAGPDVKAT